MRRWILPALIGLALPGPAAAQQLAEESGHFSFSAGVASYDLSGTGTTAIFAARVGSPIMRHLLWELGVSYLNPEQSFGKSHFFIPELQFQLHGTWGSFSPYVGLGGGASIDAPEDRNFLPGFELDTESNFAPSGSLGARFWVSDGLALRVDGRLHGIEADFTGTVAELTAGIDFSF